MMPTWYAETYDLHVTGWTMVDGRKRDQYANQYQVSGEMLAHTEEDIVKGMIQNRFVDDSRRAGGEIDPATIRMQWLDPRFPGTVGAVAF